MYIQNISAMTQDGEYQFQVSSQETDCFTALGLDKGETIGKLMSFCGQPRLHEQIEFEIQARVNRGDSLDDLSFFSTKSTDCRK